ncbi:transporter substrate-binding domain-containing protein [Bradyrhizobium sp. UFLA05-153]
MLSRAVRIAIGAFTIALGLAAGNAYAQSGKTVINAAVDPKYPPFKFKDPATNKIIGFDIDLLDAMAAKLGLKVNWIEDSFHQHLSTILTKRADVIVDIADTPARRESVSFLDYYNEYSVFFALREIAGRFTNQEALCGKRVSVARGTSWPAQVARWSDEHCTNAGKPSVILVESSTVADGRMQVNQGRVDAVVAGAGSMAYQNTLEANRYLSVARVNRGDWQGIGFSKDDPELGQVLKKALTAVIADGTYKNVLRKWNLPDDDVPERALINGQP